MFTLFPMSRIMMVVAVAMCAGACATEQGPQQVNVIDGAVIDVRPRELCSFYEWLGDRSWQEQLPFIAPMAPGTRAIVEGELVPLRGQYEVQDDGNTFVWTPLELHLQDGTVEAGAVGRRPLDEAWCEWAAAIEIQTET